MQSPVNRRSSGTGASTPLSSLTATDWDMSVATIGEHDDKIKHALKVLIAASRAESNHVGPGHGVMPNPNLRKSNAEAFLHLLLGYDRGLGGLSVGLSAKSKRAGRAIFQTKKESPGSNLSGPRVREIDGWRL
jgi:hypothetical protein